MDAHLILGLIIWYVVFVFSTTCHEASHALVGFLGGDRTAYEGGQVSLDPSPHIRREPLGMVVIPLLSFFLSGGGYMFGYASAPFDPYWAQRNPSKYARMSLAGPMANFVLALLAVVLMTWGVHAGVFARDFSGEHVIVGQGVWGAAAMTLSVLLILNVLLGLFNLLPIPPLDGAAVLEGFFPDSIGQLYQKLRGYPLAGIISFMVILNLGGRLISAPMDWLLRSALSVIFS